MELDQVRVQLVLSDAVAIDAKNLITVQFYLLDRGSISTYKYQVIFSSYTTENTHSIIILNIRCFQIIFSR